MIFCLKFEPSGGLSQITESGMSELSRNHAGEERVCCGDQGSPPSSCEFGVPGSLQQCWLD